MSWDLYAQNLPDVATLEELPDDFKPRSLGSRDAVIAAIREVEPTADFADPSWGFLDGPDWSIELSVGQDLECDCVAFHVRGGEGAIAAIQRILERLGIRAIDAQTGAFFDPEAAVVSLAQWRTYRDQIVAESSPSQGFFSRLFGKLFR